MLKRIKAWRAKRKQWRLEKRSADAIEPVFVGERIGSDEAIVFVHGLAGHFRDTWKQFPALLIGDPDLPQLDVLLAGYDASPLPWTRSIEDEARRFASNLRTIFPKRRKFFSSGTALNDWGNRKNKVETLAWDIEQLAGTLPETERLLLRELINGSPLSDIAVKLDITYGAAAVRVHRFTDKLHNIINEL